MFWFSRKKPHWVFELDVVEYKLSVPGAMLNSDLYHHEKVIRRIAVVSDGTEEGLQFDGTTEKEEQRIRRTLDHKITLEPVHYRSSRCRAVTSGYDSEVGILAGISTIDAYENAQWVTLPKKAQKIIDGIVLPNCLR